MNSSHQSPSVHPLAVIDKALAFAARVFARRYAVMVALALSAMLAGCSSIGSSSSGLGAEDLAEIRQLLARYTLLADVEKDHAGEGMREIFTEDGTFQVPGIDLYVNGIDAIVAFFRDRPGGDHHINSNLVIEGDGERAQVMSYVHIIKAEQGVESLVFGYYEDSLVKTAQGWRIQLRNTVLLGFSPE